MKKLFFMVLFLLFCQCIMLYAQGNDSNIIDIPKGAFWAFLFVFSASIIILLIGRGLGVEWVTSILGGTFNGGMIFGILLYFILLPGISAIIGWKFSTPVWQMVSFTIIGFLFAFIFPGTRYFGGRIMSWIIGLIGAIIGCGIGYFIISKISYFA